MTAAQGVQAQVRLTLNMKTNLCVLQFLTRCKAIILLPIAMLPIRTLVILRLSGNFLLKMTAAQGVQAQVKLTLNMKTNLCVLQFLTRCKAIILLPIAVLPIRTVVILKLSGYFLLKMTAAQCVYTSASKTHTEHEN